MTEPLIRAVEVSRDYGEVHALADVSLDIRPGELVGLLGPNGAGKTTLIDLFTGLRKPTSGTVEVGGGDPRDEATRQIIGVTPQKTSLPETWRVAEMADFVAAHYPRPLGSDDLLARFDLHALRERQIGGLSGGQQRRLAVALAFTGRPRVVFLDEPTTGLDVGARRDLWNGIGAFHDEGGTVLLSSHYLEEIETLAHRVVVLDRGQIIADGATRDVRSLVSLKRVSFTSTTLPRLTGVTSVDRDGERVQLLAGDADQLVRDLVTSGTEFTDLEISTATLEDAFLAMTAQQRAS